MTTLDEIKAAIEKLTFEERAQLARWIHGWSDDDWDREMIADAKNGKLDRFIAEVDEQIEKDQLLDLP